jgi:hypothetical protein
MQFQSPPSFRVLNELLTHYTRSKENSVQLAHATTVGNDGRAPDTRIFSPLAVAGLCDTIGRYWYLFKR